MLSRRAGSAASKPTALGDATTRESTAVMRAGEGMTGEGAVTAPRAQAPNRRTMASGKSIRMKQVWRISCGNRIPRHRPRATSGHRRRVRRGAPPGGLACYGAFALAVQSSSGQVAHATLGARLLQRSPPRRCGPPDDRHIDSTHCPPSDAPRRSAAVRAAARHTPRSHRDRARRQSAHRTRARGLGRGTRAGTHRPRLPEPVGVGELLEGRTAGSHHLRSSARVAAAARRAHRRGDAHRPMPRGCSFSPSVPPRSSRWTRRTRGRSRPMRASGCRARRRARRTACAG